LTLSELDCEKRWEWTHENCDCPPPSESRCVWAATDPSMNRDSHEYRSAPRPMSHPGPPSPVLAELRQSIAACASR